MSSTPLTIITDALRELGIIGAAQSAGSTEDTAFGLSRFINMLDAFNAEELMILNEREDIYLLPANLQNPSIGASGDLVGTRPVSIKDANVIDISSTDVSGTGATTGAEPTDTVLTDGTKDFSALGVLARRDLLYVISGTDVTAGIYRITAVGTTTLTLETTPGESGSAIAYRVIQDPQRSAVEVRGDRAWWASIFNRGRTGVPEQLYYSAAFPNGVINLNPVSTIPLGLELFAEEQLTSEGVVSGTTLNLAPAYYDCLMYNLAYRLARPFGKNPADYDVAAARSRALVKSNNSRIPQLVCDIPRMGGRW